uniref:Neurotransmitter-gated ion-channel transmembrane domain-containing protein n=1 Tax=Timema poppense TaxID=170557 RepID=A0A7R9D7I9_TIMPO|nr:unnamed protein product [Timema poppensis]
MTWRDISVMGNYSCLKVELIFTRDRSFYFTTVFIPGIILVTSSFITFWLEWNAVPARVMIVRWLGVTLDAKWSWDPHLRSAVGSAGGVMLKLSSSLAPGKSDGLRPQDQTFSALCDVHPALFRSGIFLSPYNHIRSVYHRFLRLILGAPPRVPNPVLLTMSGLPALDSRIRGLAERFFRRAQASSNMIVRGIGDYEAPGHPYHRIREGIGVTTMLNFFTTSNGFRSTLPVVSNLTAMNVWDGVCMCFIYASLLEFVCVNYVGRKRPLHNVVYRPGENPVTQWSRLLRVIVPLSDLAKVNIHVVLTYNRKDT